MDLDKLGIIIKTELDKSGIKADVEQIQKIINNNLGKIAPQLDKASLLNDIKSVSKEIANSINTSLGSNLKGNDVFKLLRSSINETSISTQKLVSEQKKLTTADSLSKWITNNSKATKMFGAEMNSMITKLRSGANITDTELKQLTTRIAEIKLQARDSNKLGFSGFDKIKNVWEKFGGWSLATGSMMAAVSKIKEAVTELKTVDTILTEITKTSNATEAQIKKLGEASFDAASKYGRKASDYLTSVQEMNRSGFQGKQGTDMAEQSIMAQSAGDMTEEIADKWILATNAAYEYEGEAKRINTVLDGTNEINTMVSFAW